MPKKKKKKKKTLPFYAFFGNNKNSRNHVVSYASGQFWFNFWKVEIFVCSYKKFTLRGKLRRQKRALWLIIAEMESFEQVIELSTPPSEKKTWHSFAVQHSTSPFYCVWQPAIIVLAIHNCCAYLDTTIGPWFIERKQ